MSVGQKLSTVDNFCLKKKHFLSTASLNAIIKEKLYELVQLASNKMESQ